MRGKTGHIITLALGVFILFKAFVRTEDIDTVRLILGVIVVGYSVFRLVNNSPDTSDNEEGKEK